MIAIKSTEDTTIMLAIVIRPKPVLPETGLTLVAVKAIVVENFSSGFRLDHPPKFIGRFTLFLTVTFLK